MSFCSCIFYFLSIFLILVYFCKTSLINIFFLKFIFINLLIFIFMIINLKVYKFSELIFALHSSILFLIILTYTAKYVDFDF